MNNKLKTKDKEELYENIREFYIKHGMEKFISHIEAVSDYSKIISKTYGLDEDKCVLAALIHDISGAIKRENMLDEAKEKNLPILKCEEEFPFLLHQKLSKIMAKEIFNIEDEDVLLAIEYHTSLRNNPSKYDMALYIADKLHRHKDEKPAYFNKVYSLISEKSDDGLERASRIILNYYHENKQIIHPHIWYEEARDFFNNIK